MGSSAESAKSGRVDFSILRWVRRLAQRSQVQPPRNPSPEQQCLPSPRRTLPPPCPPQHTYQLSIKFFLTIADNTILTSGRMPAWHTSGQTCGPSVPKPPQLLLCWTACRLPCKSSLNRGVETRTF